MSVVRFARFTTIRFVRRCPTIWSSSSASSA